MKDFFKFLLNIFIKAIIPAFLIYFSANDFISDFLIKIKFLVTIDNVSVYKFWAFLIGTVTVVFIVPLQLYFTEKQLKKQKRILKSQVDIILEQIAHDLAIGNSGVFIRVFKVKKCILSSEVKLIDYHIENITTRINGKKKLVFAVSPTTIQGVVGKAYSEKSFFVDYNISNNDNSYELTSEHINRIGDVKFCCSAPIVYEMEKIKYIISVDSNVMTRKSAAKTIMLKRNLVYLCQLFDEFIL